jgi:tetratricopeptide (TPR) repeat protein
MRELKIILLENDLIFELKNGSAFNYFKEEYTFDTLKGILKNYLKKIYSEKAFELGHDFLKAVKSLERLPFRVITIKPDCKWQRKKNEKEYYKIESQAKVFTNMDLYRDKQIDINKQFPEIEEVSDTLIDELNEYLRRFPENPEGYYKLGRAHLKKKSYDEAIDAFREAISLNSEKPDYYYNLGCAYFESNRLELALSEFKEAIKLDNEFETAYFKAGCVFLELEKYHEAIPFFQNSVIINPGMIEAYIKLGEVYNFLEYFDEAIYVLEEALSIDQESLSAKKNLKVAFEIKKKVETAELNNLAISYAERGKYEKAIEKFHKALGLNPDDPEIHYNLGFAYLKDGSVDQALNSFKQALMLSPSLLEIHKNIADIYRKLNKFEMAIKEYEAFLAKNPNDEKAKEVNEEIKYLKSKIK